MSKSAFKEYLFRAKGEDEGEGEGNCKGCRDRQTN